MTMELDNRQLKLVDNREPEIIRQELLKLGWLQEQLWSADYQFFTRTYKRVGVERKAIPDLMGSLGDRLSEQLFKMLEHYDFSILLLEGNWKLANEKIVTNRGIEQWGWDLVWNYLQTWQDRGLTLQLTANEGHTIKRLNELYAYYQKDVHAGGLKKSHVEDSRILALQCGGIGPKLGIALINKFGSVRNIANATIDDYLTVEKIGQSKAQSLYNHFNRNSNDIVEEIAK